MTFILLFMPSITLVLRRYLAAARIPLAAPFEPDLLAPGCLVDQPFRGVTDFVSVKKVSRLFCNAIEENNHVMGTVEK